ncbi:MAG: hypothetical protein GF372_00200, partial [Candidatus Marinimicrobia bacterium]|nr:hypothetical protein [Candidatus Neomarinimicrobiota bacterium]
MLQFSTPWILWGALAAAAPILIHLFGKRRTKQIEFSSLRFLQAMQREQIRTLKLKQIILLILRTLLILLLVFAFAGPRFAPTSASGIAHSSAIILLDNTMSTSVRSDGITYFEKLTYLAEDIVGKHDTYESVAWMPLIKSRPPVVTSGPEVPANYLADLQPAYGSLDIQSRFTEIRTWLEEQNLGSVDIFLVTDSQQSEFNSLQNINLSEWDGSRWFVVSPETAPSQAGIQGVNFSDELLQPGSFTPLSLYIGREDSIAPQSSGLQIFQNSEKIGQTLITWESSTQQNATFEIPLSHPGFFQLRAELDDDEYNADNYWFVNGYIPQTLNVLLVSDTEAGRLFPETALSSLSGERGQINYQAVTSDQLFEALTGEIDVIILSDVRLGQDMGNIIRQVVESGTGLMIFQGEQMLQPGSMEWLYNVGYGALNSLSDGTFQTVSTVQWNHPVFRQISQNDSRQIRLPRVYQYLTLSGQDGQSVMRIVNGDPFLLETTLGQGIVWTWSVGAALHWSDLPRRGIFIP